MLKHMIMGATRGRFRVPPILPMPIIGIEMVEQNTAMHDPQVLAKYVAWRPSSPEAVVAAIFNPTPASGPANSSMVLAFLNFLVDFLMDFI